MKLNELRVYNMANEVSDIVWDLVVEWDYFKKDTIGKQLVRSADSISANIAEGFGRFHYKENKNFLYYSRGSAHETLDWVSKCKRRKLLPADQCNQLNLQLEEFLIKLNAYIKSIGQKGSY